MENRDQAIRVENPVEALIYSIVESLPNELETNMCVLECTFGGGVCGRVRIPADHVIIWDCNTPHLIILQKYCCYVVVALLLLLSAFTRPDRQEVTEKHTI